MSPIVNDNMATAADLIQFTCPKCGNTQRDFIKYQCIECEKKFWYEITLDPDWFPNKLEDGTPDWNSVKKSDPKYFNNTKWEYGRLNIETMKMEKVVIDRDGKKYDYLKPNIMESELDEKAAFEREFYKHKAKSQAEIKRDVKIEKKLEKMEIKAKQQEEEAVPEEKQKVDPEVLKLIDSINGKKSKK